MNASATVATVTLVRALHVCATAGEPRPPPPAVIALSAGGAGLSSPQAGPRRRRFCPDQCLLVAEHHRTSGANRIPPRARFDTRGRGGCSTFLQDGRSTAWCRRPTNRTRHFPRKPNRHAAEDPFENSPSRQVSRRFRSAIGPVAAHGAPTPGYSFSMGAIFRRMRLFGISAAAVARTLVRRRAGSTWSPGSARVMDLRVPEERRVIRRYRLGRWRPSTPAGHRRMRRPSDVSSGAPARVNGVR